MKGPCSSASNLTINGSSESSSGAAGYKPGIVRDKQELQVHRKPIALLGKVFYKVDADHGAIEVGDLLTTFRCGLRPAILGPPPGKSTFRTAPIRCCTCGNHSIAVRIFRPQLVC